MNVHANAAPTQALHEIATHLDRGRPDSAASAARSACARWPDDAQVHRLLGIALLQQGQIAEALSALERARQLQPASIEILANLASAQAASGALDAARTSYGHAKARYAAGDIALVELLAAQRSLHEAETAAARAHTNAAVQLVALYKALGGGWDVSTTASTATHPLRGAAAPVAFSSR